MKAMKAHIMKTPVSETHLRSIIKTIVQIGASDLSLFHLSPDQQERIEQAFEIYRRRDKRKPVTGEFSTKPQSARFIPAPGFRKRVRGRRRTGRRGILCGAPGLGKRA